MKKSVIFSLVALTLALGACSSKDVGFDTLETARSQGKANAEYNAQNFRANSPQYRSMASKASCVH